MDFYDLPPQAVPTFSVSSSGSNYGSTVPTRQQQPEPAFGVKTNHGTDVAPQGTMVDRKVNRRKEKGIKMPPYQ